MLETISLKIIVPSGVVAEMSDVKFVTLPGTKGIFQILPKHMNMVATLKVGVVKIGSIGYSNKYFIYGGISENTGSNVNIVTEFAVCVDQIDKNQEKDKLEQINKQLKELDSSDDNAKFLVAALNNKVMQHKALLGFI